MNRQFAVSGVLVLAVAVSLPTFGGRAVGGTAPANSQAALAKRRATCTPRSVLSGMSTAQRVGQLFVAGVKSTGPTKYQKRMIRKHHLGGVVLMGHNNAGVNATWRVTRRLQRQARANGVGLWVSVDQEGGYVQVLHGRGFSDIPTALNQGNLKPATLRHRAHRWGRQLRAAGVNLNLAPVMDTVKATVGRANKPIGYYYREYGHTPKVVTSHGLAFRRGMRAAGVQATAKHFPGLGRVRRNTDTSYGVHDNHTTRHGPFIQPFQAAVNDGIPVVMVSSVRYNKIDRKHLAPFSSTVLRGMLRHDLGFDGVIMSDDLGAAAAVKKVPVGKRAVRFLRSGGTVVLTVKMPTIPKMTHAVLHRARTVANFSDKVDAAALQVLQAKRGAGLLPCQHTVASTSDAGVPAATAEFQRRGEHLYLCDRQPDGRRAVAHVRTSNGVHRAYDNAGGVGSCRDLNFAIPESGSISFNVCVRHGASGPLRHCSNHARVQTTDPDAPAATAEFNAYGEHLSLCDRQPDGRRAVAHVRTSKGGSRLFHDARGHGTCRDLNLSLPESGWIRFNVCVRHGASGKDRHCSRTAEADAGYVQSSARG